MFGLYNSGIFQRHDSSQTPSSKGNEASQTIASPTPGQQSPCLRITWTPNQTGLTINKYGSPNTQQCMLKPKGFFFHVLRTASDLSRPLLFSDLICVMDGNGKSSTIVDSCKNEQLSFPSSSWTKTQKSQDCTHSIFGAFSADDWAVLNGVTERWRLEKGWTQRRTLTRQWCLYFKNTFHLSQRVIFSYKAVSTFGVYLEKYSVFLLSEPRRQTLKSCRKLS